MYAYLQIQIYTLAYIYTGILGGVQIHQPTLPGVFGIVLVTDDCICGMTINNTLILPSGNW